MAYETYRVEVTRDETQDDGEPLIEITAYLDRMPESDLPTRGMLTRAAKGVWNSRLQFSGDFDTLGAALKAIEAALPAASRIGCYEYTVDDEFARAVAPLVRAGGKWQPGGA